MENKRVLKSINKNNNCSDFSKNNFVINTQTKLNDDKCHNMGNNKVNNNVNDYMLSNFTSCNCNLDDVLKVSTNNTGLIVKDGYGMSNCNIDNDSNLRIGNVDRHYKTDLQLFPRPFLTTPNVQKGELKPDIESRIQSSEQQQKQTGNYTYDQDRVYTPLLSNVSKSQSPEHIVQEYVNSSWVRGGTNTRQIINDLEYLSKSSDNDAIKTELLNQKAYLQTYLR